MMNTAISFANAPSLRWLLCGLTVLHFQSSVDAQETVPDQPQIEEAVETAAVENAEQPAQTRITLFRLNRPPQEVIKLLEVAFNDRNVQIASDDARNAVLVSGTRDQLERMGQLLKMVDHPDRQLVVDVTVHVTSTDSEQRLTDEFSIPVRQNHNARFNSSRQSIVSNVQMIMNGRPVSRSSKATPTGTIIEVTPTIVGDSVDLDFMLEKSWAEPVAAQDDAQGPAPAGPTYTGILDTSLRLRPEQTVEASVAAHAINGGQRQLKISVTVREFRPTGRKPQSTPRTPRDNAEDPGAQ